MIGTDAKSRTDVFSSLMCLIRQDSQASQDAAMVGGCLARVLGIAVAGSTACGAAMFLSEAMSESEGARKIDMKRMFWMCWQVSSASIDNRLTHDSKRLPGDAGPIGKLKGKAHALSQSAMACVYVGCKVRQS